MGHRPRTGAIIIAGAGRKGVCAIAESAGLAEGIDAVGIAQSVTGSSARGPSSRRVWKLRRAILRAIVNDARVWVRPRAFSSR